LSKLEPDIPTPAAEFWKALNEAERIRRLIDGISETLKRPGLDQIERLSLNAERSDLRVKLVELRCIHEIRATGNHRVAQNDEPEPILRPELNGVDKDGAFTGAKHG
jgi:hypothetical protein